MEIQSWIRRFGAELALLTLCLFLFGWNLGGAPLLDYDEALYVTCAQQMVLSGDWTTPRLNTRMPERPGVSQIAFFEKPIFVYWTAASSMRLLGRNMWAARFPVALVALLTTFIVYSAGRHWFGRRAGLLAAMTYATAPMTLVDARQMTTDGLLVLWITLALLSFWQTQQPSEKLAPPSSVLSSYLSASRLSGLSPYLFWLVSALAVLTKGVVGLLLPFLIIGIYLLMDRLILRVYIGKPMRPHIRFTLKFRPSQSLWQGLARLRPLSGILLFLLIIAPWHLLIMRGAEHDAQGRTWWMEYIMRQHVGRFRGLDAVHNQPLPTFLVYFLLGFFPWACFVPAAFRNLDKSAHKRVFAAQATEQKRNEKNESESNKSEANSNIVYSHSTFLLVWFWTIFIFFSLGAAKLPTYITPAYPAAALLLGSWLDRVLPGGRKAGTSFVSTDDTHVDTNDSQNHNVNSLNSMRSAEERSAGNSGPEWKRSGSTLRRGAACACVVGLLLLIAGMTAPSYTPASVPIPLPLLQFACHVALLFTLGSGIAWGCFALRTEEGRSRGVIVLAIMMVLVIGDVSTEGYAVLHGVVLDPYQHLAVEARPDAQSGLPIVFYHIVPRRPSMLFYAGYAPFERKETILLPFLAACLTPSQRQADIITTGNSYTHLLLPELNTLPGATARRLDQRGPADGWVLARVFVPTTYVPPPLPPRKEGLWTPVSY